MSPQGKILIVDDDPLVLEALYQVFLDDYEVITASSGAAALDQVRQHADIDTVVLDIRMAKMDGLETASAIRATAPSIPLIFNTGYPGEYSQSEIDRQHKPFDYIGKNESPARLQRAVRNAVRLHRLETSGSDELVEIARSEFHMVGRSRPMLDIYRTIEKIGLTDNKVMILGPTGAGKELVARALHARSRRSDRPLAIFNCNHKAPDLVESELFGHLRGSFTGAIADQIGIIEYADGGTLFLDEIGNLDITTQGKLLRVLETGEMSRIGSPEVVVVDVRIICATNCDLDQMVHDQSFRNDLYFRLKGIRIELPPLSDRAEDIPSLVEHFSSRYCEKSGEDFRLFEDSAIRLLVEYAWPGNVRELADAVESLIGLSTSALITRDEVAAYLSFDGSRFSSAEPGCGLNEMVRLYKIAQIESALQKHNANYAAAARELAIDPANLRRLVKSLGIQVDRFNLA